MELNAHLQSLRATPSWAAMIARHYGAAALDALSRGGVDYAVRVRVEEQVHSGRLSSLSRMGALVVVDRPVAVGTATLALIDSLIAS